jgi:hypothetical protein
MEFEVEQIKRTFTSIIPKKQTLVIIGQLIGRDRVKSVLFPVVLWSNTVLIILFFFHFVNRASIRWNLNNTDFPFYDVNA